MTTIKNSIARKSHYFNCFCFCNRIMLQAILFVRFCLVWCTRCYANKRQYTCIKWKQIWTFKRDTAVLPQNRSFDSVWSKIGTLQDCIVLCKSAATPLPTLWFLTTNESFQMRYCMNFFFKGHQNCQKSNLKVHEKSCFIKWIWKAKTLTSGHSDAPWGKSSYSTSFESSH